MGHQDSKQGSLHHCSSIHFHSRFHHTVSWKISSPALLLSGSSSQRWLLTRMPGRRRDLPRNSVMEPTVEMDTAAMMQTTLFAVLMAFGAELLLMTALLLSRSSSQWLLTRDLPRKIQIVEMDGGAMTVTTQSAAA